MQNLFNQALSYHQAGQLDKAEELYRQLLSEQGGHPVVMARLGILLGQKNKLIDSLDLLKKAIDALPNEFELIAQGIHIATQAGENATAEIWLRKAIALRPKEVALREQLVGVLIGNHKEKEALELVKEVIKLNPQSANAYNLKGLALSRLGDTEKGYKGFQKAVKMNPGQLGAVRNLLTYGKGKKEPLLDQIIPQLEQQLRKPDLPPQAKMNMAYIASMYYEKKNPAKMFQYLKQGNDINRTTYRYKHEDTEKLFSDMKRVFDEDFVEFARGKGFEDESAVFILGMPRSGTTLIEQILSSHSQVEAEGEILDLNQAFDKHTEILFGENSTNEAKLEACIAIGKSYIESVRGRNASPMFTDKLPYNYIMVGVIAIALPNAKIIHCTRDPIETCFSIYKQNFSGTHMYKNDLTELGQYYKAYEGLMAYWEGLLPNRIYEANYERMVDFSEAEIPNLIEFCGLEMEPACLGFHKNKRAVRTASVAQVRQPIYKSAKKASTDYQKFLGPLIAVLS